MGRRKGKGGLWRRIRKRWQASRSRGKVIGAQVQRADVRAAWHLRP